MYIVVRIDFLRYFGLRLFLCLRCTLNGFCFIVYLKYVLRRIFKFRLFIHINIILFKLILIYKSILVYLIRKLDPVWYAYVHVLYIRFITSINTFVMILMSLYTHNKSMYISVICSMSHKLHRFMTYLNYVKIEKIKEILDLM